MSEKRRALEPGERRRQIMQAASRCFAQRGFERTTTRDIACEAGIAEGTIYNYFASKHELLLAFADIEVIEPLVTIFTGMPDADDEEILRAFIADRLTLWERRAPLMKVLASEGLYNPQLATAAFEKIGRPALLLLEGYITRRIHEGKFRAMDSSIVARALIGQLLSQFMFWGTFFGHVVEFPPREQFIYELTQLMLCGLRAPRGEGRAQ